MKTKVSYLKIFPLYKQLDAVDCGPSCFSHGSKIL